MSAANGGATSVEGAWDLVITIKGWEYASNHRITSVLCTVVVVKALIGLVHTGARLCVARVNGACV
jgi:hypothetical protein